MTSKKLKGLVLAIYGVLMDLFALNNIIPLLFEKHVGSTGKGVLIIWSILWFISFGFIVAGISLFDEKTENTMSNHTITTNKPPVNSESSVICPKCGNSNSKSATYCTSCSEKLDKTPIENAWVCPNCGRINQNYVGTCGCGEVKPK